MGSCAGSSATAPSAFRTSQPRRTHRNPRAVDRKHYAGQWTFERLAMTRTFRTSVGSLLFRRRRMPQLRHFEQTSVHQLSIELVAGKAETRQAAGIRLCCEGWSTAQLLVVLPQARMSLERVARER